MARILITRAPHQASELADRLRKLGHEPILIPTIEFARPSSYAALDQALANLESFHWLLFTSANAVEAFKARIEDARKPLVDHLSVLKSTPKIAAIGPSTARALQSIGLPPTLVPKQATAESLAEALLPHSLQADGNVRMLLIRAEIARDNLPEALRSAGAEVTIAAAYKTVIAAASIPLITKLFRSRQNYPDAIIFTSSSTALNLIALLEASHQTLPVSIARISIGPITSQTLCDLNLPPHVEASEPTVSALVEALTSLLSTHQDQD